MRLTGKGSQKFYSFAKRQVEHMVLGASLGKGAMVDSYQMGIAITEKLEERYAMYPAEYDFCLHATESQWQAAMDKAYRDGSR